MVRARNDGARGGATRYRAQPPLTGRAEGTSPTAGGLGMTPKTSAYNPLPLRKGARGMLRALLEAALPHTGRAEGTSPTARGLGVSPRSSSYCPLPLRKGARGMLRALLEAALPHTGRAEGPSPSAGGLGGPPELLLTTPFLRGRGPGGWSALAMTARAAGRSATARSPTNGACRGARPPLPGVWGCPPDLLPTSHLPLRKGIRGMVCARNDGARGGATRYRAQPHKRGVQRGLAPLPGAWGCPPELLLISPFLRGRGPGGWSALAMTARAAGRPATARSPTNGACRGA